MTIIRINNPEYRLKWEYQQEIALRFRLFRLLVQADHYTMAQVLGVPASTIEAIEAGRIDYQEYCFYAIRENYGLSLDWLWMGDGNIFNRPAKHTPLPVYLAACYYGTGLTISVDQFAGETGTIVKTSRLKSPEIYNFSSAYAIYEQTGHTHIAIFDNHNEVLYYNLSRNPRAACKLFNCRFPAHKSEAVPKGSVKWSQWYTPEISKITELIIKLAAAQELDALHKWKSFKIKD